MKFSLKRILIIDINTRNIYISMEDDSFLLSKPVRLKDVPGLKEALANLEREFQEKKIENSKI